MTSANETTGANDMSGTPQANAPRRDPPKWKMAILTSVVIYPFLLINPALLSPLVGDAPEWLAILANVVFTIPLMTWLVMPAATGLLKGWLHEASADAASIDDETSETWDRPTVDR